MEAPIEWPRFSLDSTMGPRIPVIETVESAPVFDGQVISEKPKEMDVMFSVFFVCFLLFAFAFSSRGRQTLALIKSDLFQLKSRSSIFFETTGNDFTSRLLLGVQAVLLTAVFFFIYASANYEYTPHALKAVAIIGGFSLAITAYLLLKWIGYKLLSYVFFSPEVCNQWMRSWGALLSLHVLVVFIPTILFCYLSSFYEIGLYWIVGWFVLSRLILLYKSYLIFFNSLDRLHYLFLYLCTQEIIPLFLLYKGCNYVFNVLENCDLWV